MEKACSLGPGTSSASFPPVCGHQFLHAWCAPARSAGSDTHLMPLQPPHRSTVVYMNEAAAMSKALWKFLYKYKSKRRKLLAKTDRVKKLKLFPFRVCLGLHLPDHPSLGPLPWHLRASVVMLTEQSRKNNGLQAPVHVSVFLRVAKADENVKALTVG